MVISVDESHRAVPSTSSSFRVNPEYAQIAELLPGLYICGVSSLTPENMEKYNITLIINVTNEVPNARILGPIPRIKLWLDDIPSTNIYQHFDHISDQIETVISGGGNVLVHCVAGVSRSATICLAYLTKYRCCSLRQAYKLMTLKRPLVRPNIGFWKQLVAYEQVVKRRTSSIRFVKDSDDPLNILPDVYVMADSDFLEEADCQKGRWLSGSKRKFQPVLETVPESIEVGT